MDFNNFPFDYQICYFQMFNYGIISKELKFVDKTDYKKLTNVSSSLSRYITIIGELSYMIFRAKDIKNLIKTKISKMVKTDWREVRI